QGAGLARLPVRRRRGPARPRRHGLHLGARLPPVPPPRPRGEPRFRRRRVPPGPLPRHVVHLADQRPNDPEGIAMTVLEKAELTPELGGKYYSPKRRWWCAPADLTDDAGVETALYFWPALGSLDEAWICSLHVGGEVIDLTQLHLPLETFGTSRSGV